MATIQSLPTAPAPTPVSQNQQAAPRREVNETGQSERQETGRGAQEVGEAAPPSATLGQNINTLA